MTKMTTTNNWTPADEALKMLGLSVDEVEEAIADAKERRENPERHVCICGHAKARHFIDENGGVSSCKPAKWACLCHQYKSVLQCQDTRDFLFRTEGAGKEHALTKGVANAHSKGHSIQWLEDAYSCALCATTEDLSIYSISGNENVGFHVSTTREVDYDMGRRNAFLCKECVGKI